MSANKFFMNMYGSKKKAAIVSALFLLVQFQYGATLGVSLILDNSTLRLVSALVCMVGNIALVAYSSYSYSKYEKGERDR